MAEPGRLPRVDALLLAVLRPALPGVVVGSRMPDTMPDRFCLARRAGGASMHPEFADVALVDVQTWAPSDTESEAAAQAARDALYAASLSGGEFGGVGGVVWFAEEDAPVALPTELADHGMYRYQAFYRITTRPPRAS